MIVLICEASMLIRVRYAPELSNYSKGRRAKLLLNWGLNHIEQHLEALGDGRPTRPGGKASLSYFPSMSMVHFVWPSGRSHIYYRAFATPLRPGNLAIVHLDQVSEHCRTIKGPSEQCVEGPNMIVTLAARSKARPSFRGVGVSSPRSRFGCFPVESCVSAEIVSPGTVRQVPVSPYRKVEELVRIGESGASELRLVGVDGCEVVWHFDAAEVGSVLVSIAQHRTLFGRSLRWKKTWVTVEYWTS